MLWIEDPATGTGQFRAAIWAVTGGAIVFIGSLLPFIRSADPYLPAVSRTPAEAARLYGVVLAGLGACMLSRLRPHRVLFGILTLAFAGLSFLTLAGFIAVGLAGNDQSHSYGAASGATYYPGPGIFLSILGCVPAAVGAVMSLRRR